MPNTANIQLAALSIIISLAGCAIDESGLDLGVNGYDLNATNGLPINGLPINGLPINGLPINGLPINGLADASVETDLDAWLNDPTYGAAHNTLMRYMVRCALPAGTDSSFVDSADHTWIWYGEIGLAPSWANGSMTAAEKRWVSSCVHLSGQRPRPPRASLPARTVHLSLRIFRLRTGQLGPPRRRVLRRSLRLDSVVLLLLRFEQLSGSGQRPHLHHDR